MENQKRQTEAETEIAKRDKEPEKTATTTSRRDLQKDTGKIKDDNAKGSKKETLKEADIQCVERE